MRVTPGNTLPTHRGNTTHDVVMVLPGVTGATVLHSGNAILILAICLAGYVALILITLLHQWQYRHRSHISASDRALRRELSRHRGDNG